MRRRWLFRLLGDEHLELVIEVSRRERRFLEDRERMLRRLRVIEERQPDDDPSVLTLPGARP
jgi:hypothetical protein